MAQQQPLDDSYRPQYEIVTSALRIAAILRPLLRQHSIISVAIPNAKRIFSTTLLDIDTDKQQLIFDELHPKEGHELLSQSKQLKMRAQRDGIDLIMALEISAIGSENGVAFYTAPLPESIRYHQRRSAFRVQVGPLQDIPVQLTYPDGKAVHGVLFDISASGMCVRVPRKTALPDTRSGEELHCSISLPDKKKINCVFVIRHVAEHEPSRSLHIGGSFEHLDNIQKRAIERFSLELQRQSRRKQELQ